MKARTFFPAGEGPGFRVHIKNVLKKRRGTGFVQSFSFLEHLTFTQELL